MYRKSVKRFKKRKFCNIEWFLISFWIVSIIKLGSNIQGKPTSYFFSVLMNYSWTKTLVQEQFAWNLSSCLTKIWISPTLQVGWSGLPKHQLMLDFIFPPNLSELPFLVIPMLLGSYYMYQSHKCCTLDFLAFRYIWMVFKKDPIFLIIIVSIFI